MSFWKKKPDGTSSSVESTPSSPGSEAASRVSGDLPPKVGETSALSSKPSSEGAAPGGFGGALPTGSQKPEDVLLERFGKTRSALSEGTVIQGKLSFDTPVRIDGKLSGEIFSSKVLIVGPSGKIDATIEVASLVVLGHVSGNISASERVELWAGATVEGTIKSPTLVVQEGSSFSGTSHMVVAQAGYAADMAKASEKSSDKQKSAEKKSAGAKGQAAGLAEETAAEKEARVH